MSGKPEQWAVVDPRGRIRGTGISKGGAWVDAWIQWIAADPVQDWVKARESEGWTCTIGEWRAT